MAIRITVQHRDGRRESHVFHQTEVRVGRTPENDLVLPEDMIARRHSRFFAQGERVFAQTLDAPSGIYVNGDRRGGRAVPLTPSDRVLLGTSIVTAERVNDELGPWDLPREIEILEVRGDFVALARRPPDGALGVDAIGVLRDRPEEGLVRLRQLATLDDPMADRNQAAQLASWHDFGNPRLLPLIRAWRDVEGQWVMSRERQGVDLDHLLSQQRREQGRMENGDAAELLGQLADIIDSIAPLAQAFPRFRLTADEVHVGVDGIVRVGVALRDVSMRQRLERADRWLAPERIAAERLLEEAPARALEEAAAPEPGLDVAALVFSAGLLVSGFLVRQHLWPPGVHLRSLLEERVVRGAQLPKLRCARDLRETLRAAVAIDPNDRPTARELLSALPASSPDRLARLVDGLARAALERQSALYEQLDMLDIAEPST